MAQDKYPIPETEEERNQAMDELAEKQVRERVPPQEIERVGLSNLVADLKEQISLNYPESRESRGR
jgi:hypothetical protein